MSAMTDYLENKLIDHLFRASSFTKPAALWVALFTAAPSDAGGGTEVSASTTGYGRVQHGPSDTAWKSTNGQTSGDSSGTGGQTTNATAVTFGSPTAAWGNIVAFAIFDAETSGNMLAHGSLTTPKVVNNGDNPPEFQPNALTFTLA
jgi:hypothetical protein